MSREKEKFVTTDALNEEYYQITLDILSKFPKFHPPLSLYEFREDVSVLIPFYSPGQRLDKEKQEMLEESCKQGHIFVSRTDHPIYAKHISEQLDLVLLDKNLNEREILEIFAYALPKRINEFFDQPVVVVWEKLHNDLMVLVEYLTQDPFRSRGLFKNLLKNFDLGQHEFNVGIVGLTLYIRSFESPKTEISLKMLERLALGLFVHDVGLSKVPAFIREKTVPLTLEDQEKIQKHPHGGAAVMRKLGVVFDETLQCITDHHERLDGSGYPQKKQGKDISLAGSICAIADSFSAMISKRPYSSPKPVKEAAAALFQDPKYDPRFTKILQILILTE